MDLHQGADFSGSGGPLSGRRFFWFGGPSSGRRFFGRGYLQQGADFSAGCAHTLRRFFSASTRKMAPKTVSPNIKIDHKLISRFSDRFFQSVIDLYFKWFSPEKKSAEKSATKSAARCGVILDAPDSVDSRDLRALSEAMGDGLWRTAIKSPHLHRFQVYPEPALGIPSTQQ